MESIDKLREYVENVSRMSISLMARATLLGMVRDIECEVADMVSLPVDADGVPIHVGDVMENIVCPPVHREVGGVGVECFYGWDKGNGRYSQFDVACYRHHHAPTVEDVLREFGIDWEHESDCEDRAALLKEYAAKLRLKEDE